jgi:Peptidase family M28
LESPQPPRAGARDLCLLVLILLAIAWLTAIRARGPAPKGSDAPAGEFSAARAHAELRNLLGGDGLPHPVGSAEHDLVRDRIVARLHQLGYNPDVRHDLACSPYASCGTVDNIVMELPGRKRGKALLLAAHYDSVPAGPGASDDGSGTAALLEIARILRLQPPEHPVILLIDDGEELGLLGAEAFVRNDPRAKNAGAVINVDSRGTAGTVFMFETSRGNEWLIDRLADAKSSYSAGSLFYAVYERLPNDSDLTVFKRAGIQGLNFANLGNVFGYHTPLDTAANASLRTMQQRGDNILAITRSLDASDLAGMAQKESARRNAVYFDVLQFHIVHWPAPWTPTLAILNLFAVAIAGVLLVRGGSRDAVRGFVAVLLTIIAAGAGGYGLLELLSLRGTDVWAAYPLPAALAACFLGTLIAAATAAGLLRKSTLAGSLAGVGTVWAVLSVVAAWIIAEGSYLLLVPSLALTLICLTMALRRETTANVAWLVLIPAAVSALMIYPLVMPFYDALGQVALLIIAIVIGLAATTFMPLIALSGRRVRLLTLSALALLFVVSAVAALALPQVTREHPHQLNLTLIEDADRGTARFAAPDLTPALRSRASWSTKREALYPWSPSTPLTATAAGVNLPPPDIQLVSEKPNGAGRTLTFRIQSNRGASRVGLALHSDSPVTGIVVDGWRVEREAARPGSRYRKGWTRINVTKPPPTASTIEVTLGGNAPFEAYGLDISPGLGPTGVALIAARNEGAVPAHEGDSTIVMKRMK